MLPDILSIHLYCEIREGNHLLLYEEHYLAAVLL